MSGREVIASRTPMAESQDSSGGGVSGQQAWRTALAVVLPVLAVAVLGYQVRALPPACQQSGALHLLRIGCNIGCMLCTTCGGAAVLFLERFGCCFG